MSLFADIFRGKRVLLTGHTGFKGSWLALWLQELGAEVTGVSLSPETKPNHWDLLSLNIDDRRLDIRDADSLLAVFKETQPDIVFHLAAQALVRRSYADPLETWSTNVIGTANVLDSCRKTPSVRAIVSITTDKCYKNNEWSWGYRETDRLGGYDPYSASKAGAELVAASYRQAFFGTSDGPLLATARAGNVIGGGDWSEDRLIPDLVRAIHAGNPLEVRSPNSTRPWQHVLESLSGYLMLGQRLLNEEKSFAEAWNFGPDREGNRSVAEVLGTMEKFWPSVSWHVTDKHQPHEAGLLYLDSSKAQHLLKWRPVWLMKDTLEMTTEWYRAKLEQEKVITQDQLSNYIESAKMAGIDWAV